jgi:hypothetical protein
MQQKKSVVFSGVMISRVMFSGMVLACALSLSAANMNAANSPIIGMVSSDPGQAGVRIDGERVSSNATLFDGSEVSSAGYSRVQLNSGARVNLGANSVVRVFANYASLEGGASEIQNSVGYAINARSLRIQAAENGAIARVRLDGDQKVLVTAVTAPVNVWNSQGLLVARVLPEAPMSFLPQAAASNSFSNSGCVVNKSNTAVLVDTTGNQVFELHNAGSGVDVRKFVGKRAAVTGAVNSSATPIQGANQIINVATISAAQGGDCAPVAARIGGTMTAAGIAGGAAAGAATAGAAGAGAAAAGTSGAVIGGVVAAGAAAAVVGGLAAAGTFSSTSP